MKDLQLFVEGLIQARFRTAGALARAMGMTLSAFSRGVRTGTFSVENCLRLAEASGEPPSQLLKMAGKGDVAALIERMYGKDAVSPADRQLLHQWHALDPSAREHFEVLIKLTSAARGGVGGRRKSA